MALESELKTYREKLPELLVHEGKYALSKGDDLVDVYDTYSDAIQSGYEKFRLEPFLVKKITAEEQVQYFTRPISPCPT